MNKDDETKVILVTGAARRIGAAIARGLHQRGARLVLHYYSSVSQAQQLADELNAIRADSVCLLQADLLSEAAVLQLAEQAVTAFGRLDGLVNNASGFFATELGQIAQSDWQDLMRSNLKAPLFLSQALAPELRCNVP